MKTNKIGPHAAPLLLAVSHFDQTYAQLDPQLTYTHQLRPVMGFLYLFLQNKISTIKADD